MHYILITVTSLPTSPRSIPYSIISQLYVLSLSSRILWSAICAVIYMVLSMQPSTGMGGSQPTWGHTIRENQCSSSWRLPVTSRFSTRSGCFMSASPLHVGISSAWARTVLSPKWDIYAIPLLQRLREPLRRGRRESRKNGGARGGGWLQWIPVFQT